MRTEMETAIKNAVYILILELILFPLGIVLYLFHGFHIYHAVLVFGYLYAIKLIAETANILLKHVHLIDKEKDLKIP